MKIYIAYKYRYHDDKKALQDDLVGLADFFAENGHKAFILGRDIQKWHSINHSKFSTLVEIIKNIGKHDTIFVFNDSNVHSNGLPVELILAKLLGLKIIYAASNDVKPWVFDRMADVKVRFSNLTDLKAQVAHLLS